MKITALIPVALLAFTLTGFVARAQENGAPATPPTPIAISGVVQVQTLPTPPTLLKDAEAEGLTILRMEQSPEKIVVVYQYPNGATRAFAYTTRVETTARVASPVTSALPLSSATYSVVSQAAPITIVAAAPTKVVYTQPSTVYYASNSVGYYNPYWYPWAPFAVGVGIGWNYSYYGGHGGYYGGHRGYYNGHGRHYGGRPGGYSGGRPGGQSAGRPSGRH